MWRSNTGKVFHQKKTRKQNRTLQQTPQTKPKAATNQTALKVN
jgi:hypothetical protein